MELRAGSRGQGLWGWGEWASRYTLDLKGPGHVVWEGKRPLTVQAEDCPRGQLGEGDMQRAGPTRLANQANGYLALFTFRTNTGRLEFPLGLSPTQTGLVKAFS